MLRCVEAADATLRVKNRIPEDPRGSAADRLLSIVPLLMHLEDEESVARCSRTPCAPGLRIRFLRLCVVLAAAEEA
jgi:hypothetical protein